MRPTETSAAILSTPSKAPAIPPHQTATNGIGWEVQLLTKRGWRRVPKLPLFKTMAEAEGMAQACHFARPNWEFRAYEALEAA